MRTEATIRRGKILNVRPSPASPGDWGIGDASAGGVFSGRGGSPPKSFSWINKDVPVQHQGTTGACVGYAAAYGVLWPMALKAGLLSKGDMPSARFVWMGAKETDNISFRPTTFVDTSGTRLKYAVRIITKYGCPLEEDLPMKPKVCKLSEGEVYARASKLRARNYYAISRDPEDWKKWISEVGPILTRMVPDPQFLSGRKKVLSGYVPQPPSSGGHAITMSGYSDAGVIIRNSWGTAWGMNGYIVMDWDYAIEALTESFGITL